MTATSAACTRCRTVVEAGDLRCPVCYLPVPPVEGDQNEAIRAQVLRCRSCAAAVEYRPRVQALHCAFCGGIVKLEERVDPVEQAGKYLPFQVDRTQALEVYHQWISRQGFFRPFSLASEARTESLQALWWVGWAVDADALVTWTVDSNAGAGRAQWAPHAGELQTVFDDLVIPATRGLSEQECARLVPTYTLESGFSLPTDADAEIVRERFDVPRSFARTRIIGAIQHLTEARIKGQHVPGSRYRNFHSSIQLRGLVTRRLGFPAYVLVYRYQRTRYRMVISGQDPNCVIGEAPRSVAKLLLVVVAAAMGLVALVIALIRLVR